MNNLQKIFIKMRLRTKLFLSYFILITLPLLLYTLFSYNSISTMEKKQTIFSAEQMLKQTEKMIFNIVSSVSDVSEQIYTDSQVNDILVNDLYHPVTPELVGNYNNLHKILQKQFKRRDMDQITLYISDGIFYSHYEPSEMFFAETVFSSIELIKNESWYEELIYSSNKTIWLPPSINKQYPSQKEPVVSCLSIVRNNNSYSSPLAILRIDLLESRFNDIMKSAVSVKGGSVFMQNSKGEIIAFSDATILKKYINLYQVKDENRIENIDSNKAVVSQLKIDGTDWNIVFLTPYSVIKNAGNKIMFELLILMMIITAVACVIAYIISNSITKPINSLTKRIKKVQHGDFSSIMNIYKSSTYEISELSYNYNYMIDRLKILSKQQYESGQELKSAELRALQAQINPHFLYNTLDIINWIALSNGVPKISDIVLSLAKFYKLSLSKGKDVIPISDEILHIETYVKLQNYRYSDAINLEINIPSEIAAYNILKLTLQPIVENSILHGILETSDKHGTIRIDAKLDNQCIIFTVFDDGVGMTSEQIETILNNSTNISSSNGYGIKNVNNRLKLFYGENFGIRYDSTIEHGCMVIITIEAQK